MEKYIYLMQSVESGAYKIGISNKPQRRLSEVNTGNDSEVKLINTYKTQNYHFIEKVLHRRYKPLNLTGEWFNLSIIEEVTFIDECIKIDNMYKKLKELDNVFI